MKDSPHYTLKPGDLVTRYGYLGTYVFLEYLTNCGERWAMVKKGHGAKECVISYDLKRVKTPQ